jgi:hypothetical protein
MREGFAFIRRRGHMPALFAYLFAVSVLLGGGYVGLHRLAAPPDASTNERPSASKRPPATRKDVVEKPDLTAAGRAKMRPDDHDETETTASTPTLELSDKAAPEATQSASAPKELQAAEPAKPVGGENADLNKNGSPSSEANARGQDVSPSGRATPGQEPEVIKRAGTRNMQSSHREERLLPMGHSRRTAFGPEEQWFNPLTFR